MDLGGWGWIIMDIVAVVLLGLAIAYGGYSTMKWRRERGLPVDARQASPAEARYNAAVGYGREKSTGGYLVRLGIPVLLALAVTAVLVWIYMNR